MNAWVLFDRPAAAWAVAVGLAALCIVVLAFLVRRKRARYAAARQRCRDAVAAARRACRARSAEERRLVPSYVRLIKKIAADNGIPLHDVGTNDRALEKLEFLARGPSVPSPYDRPFDRHYVRNPNEPGTPGLLVNAAAAVRRPIVICPDVRPSRDPEPDVATAEPSDGPPDPFAPAFAPCGEITIDLGENGDGPGEFIVLRDEEADPPNDPIKALKTVDDDTLDAYVEHAVAAMQRE